MQRVELKRPYFIVGALRPVEQQTTDATGVAHLNDRAGMWLEVDAPGYRSESVKIPEAMACVIVLLQRAGDERPGRVTEDERERKSAEEDGAVKDTD